MERNASETGKGRERARKRSIDYNKNRSVFNIGMAVAGGVAAVLSATSARTETLEDRLGNIENYNNVPFLDQAANRVTWCRVQNNSLRWRYVNRGDSSQRTVLERDFRPIYPAGLVVVGEERLVHENNLDRAYNASFDTDLGNRFEHVGISSEASRVLFRGTDRFMESPLSGTDSFAFGKVAPLWGNKVCVVTDGPNRGGTQDTADIRCADAMETRVPINKTTFSEIFERRIDLSADPSEADQVAQQASFAATQDHAFVTEWLLSGLRDLTKPTIIVYDRSGSDVAVNKRVLLEHPAPAPAGVVTECAFGDDDSTVLFITKNDEPNILKAGVFLKDADSDSVPNLADNCRDIPNPADDFGRQLNSDEDPLGDACDRCPQDSIGAGALDDQDNDNVCNRIGNESMGTTGNDNCPDVANPDQLDSDSDRRGDACDACPLDRENDRDRDGLCGDVDPCPTDRTNEDPDQDTLCGFDDVCPLDPLNDEDHDFLCANEDPCPTDFENLDEDRDGLCDNVNDPCVGDPENLDADHDGLCDRINDPCLNDSQNRDTDEDGMCDPVDNCMVVPNEHQENTFGNEQGDACESRPQPDAGMTDEPDSGIPNNMPDASTPSRPDASDGQNHRDAGTEKNDRETSVSKPPKEGCVNCNQTGRDPSGIAGIIAFALSRTLRRRKSAV